MKSIHISCITANFIFLIPKAVFVCTKKLSRKTEGTSYNTAIDQCIAGTQPRKVESYTENIRLFPRVLPGNESSSLEHKRFRLEE